MSVPLTPGPAYRGRQHIAGTKWACDASIRTLRAHGEGGHVNLLGLRLWDSKPQTGAHTAETRSFAGREAGSPRSRRHQGLVFPRAGREGSLLDLWVAVFSLRPLTRSSVCPHFPCLKGFPGGEPSRHAGSESPAESSRYHHPCKHPLQTQSHSEVLAVGTPTHGSVGTRFS